MIHPFRDYYSAVSDDFEDRFFFMWWYMLLQDDRPSFDAYLNQQLLRMK